MVLVTTGTGSADSPCKRPESNYFQLHHSYLMLPLLHESTVDAVNGLCSSKTLFANAGGRPDLACSLELAALLPRACEV